MFFFVFWVWGNTSNDSFNFNDLSEDRYRSRWLAQVLVQNSVGVRGRGMVFYGFRQWVPWWPEDFRSTIRSPLNFGRLDLRMFILQRVDSGESFSHSWRPGVLTPEFKVGEGQEVGQSRSQPTLTSDRTRVRPYSTSQPQPTWWRLKHTKGSPRDPFDSCRNVILVLICRGRDVGRHEVLKKTSLDVAQSGRESGSGFG